ncbi:MAG TPA: hypothetical protein PLH94_05345 [Fimbriimonadaceae bacterium]|nr:hypothetical protein [Fimbriimonadaceae bacterium]
MKSATGSQWERRRGSGKRCPGIETAPTFGPFASRPELAGLLESGSDREVLRQCRRLLRQDPSNVAVREVAVRAEWHLGRYQDVLRTTRRLIADNPSEPGYRFLEALTLRALGRWAASMNAARRGVEECEDARFLGRYVQLMDELNQAQLAAIEKLRVLDADFAPQYERNPTVASRNLGFEMSWFEADPVRMGRVVPATQPYGVGLPKA